jgi:hypothetical protein
LFALLPTTAAPITRIWLTHPVSDGSQLMVNWETETAAPSRVDFGPGDTLGESQGDDTPVTLHHVAIPFPTSGTLYYRVTSGDQQSAIHTVKSYGNETLRVALAADWQQYPPLDALRADKPHLLVGCGDFVPHIINLERPGAPEYTGAFSAAVDQYPALFATTPFMPALGNHDRQNHPRMFDPVNEPTYDLEATAFRIFFPLPGDGWKWHLDIPGFDTRFIALDLSHTKDMDTNWQSCMPWDEKSAQFRWYRELMAASPQRFVVTVYNEQHRQVRQKNEGAWGRLIQQGSLAVTGFGLFAERAEVEGFPFLNTALKAGHPYPDTGNTTFIESTPNYVLLTIPRGPGKLVAEIKSLEGVVLDRSAWPGRDLVATD